MPSGARTAAGFDHNQAGLFVGKVLQHCCPKARSKAIYVRFQAATNNDGRLFVRVKNKSVLAMKGMLTPPKGKRVAIEDMKP